MWLVSVSTKFSTTRRPTTSGKALYHPSPIGLSAEEKEDGIGSTLSRVTDALKGR